MNYTDFTSLIVSFSSKRKDLAGIEKVPDKINIALRQVARDTIPLRLLKNASSNRKILRRITNKSYICIPELVTEESIDIEIDFTLLDAVGLFVLAGIETARAPAYMKMYWNIIDNHDISLIDADLSLNYVVTGDMSTDTPDIIVDRNEYDMFINSEVSAMTGDIVGEYNG